MEGDLVADATLALAKLHEHFEAGRAFRDIEIPVRLGQRTQWWSLTAKPVGDGTGSPNGFIPCGIQGSSGERLPLY